MNIFSTEQVSKWHPDKYADQVSDAIVTELLKNDKQSKAGVEVMVKDHKIILGGEVRTNAKINYKKIAKRVAKKLDYKVDKVYNFIGLQSNEIFNGITKEDGNTGAGDQGIMFGYATRESESYLPFAFDLANKIIELIENDVDYNKYTILKGDAKTQVMTDLDKKQDIRAITEILISACHKEGTTLEEVRKYITRLIEPLLEGRDIKLTINPAGTWNVGGPVSDCGLTGRKIVCDQYGGFAPVGGGAFSGKEPSKVDRSAAYMARQIAIDILKQFKDVKWAEVQLGYAIGVAEPTGVNVKTNLSKSFNTGISEWVISNYDLTPRGMIKHLDLLNKDYEKISQGCHYRYTIA